MHPAIRLCVYEFLAKYMATLQPQMTSFRLSKQPWQQLKSHHGFQEGVPGMGVGGKLYRCSWRVLWRLVTLFTDIMIKSLKKYVSLVLECNLHIDFYVSTSIIRTVHKCTVPNMDKSAVAEHSVLTRGPNIMFKNTSGYVKVVVIKTD